jgi:PAS domain S-box-containing protein
MSAAAQRETSGAVARRVVVVTGLLLTLFTVVLAGALVELREAQRDARNAVAGQARSADAAAHREVELADAQVREIQRLLVLLAFAVLAFGALLAGQLVHVVRRSFGRLGESEERFRTLVANIPGAVYRRPLDPAAPMEFVSATIEEISGFAAAEFASGARRYGEILADGQRDLLERATAQAVERGGAFSVEYAIVHADGTTRWVKDIGRPVRAADGALAGLDGTLSDVTEIKRLGLELRVAQKLEAVGQLAAGIAHEINTPIQFVGDSVGFLHESFADLLELLGEYGALCRRAVDGRPGRGRDPGGACRGG